MYLLSMKYHDDLDNPASLNEQIKQRKSTKPSKKIILGGRGGDERFIIQIVVSKKEKYRYIPKHNKRPVGHIANLRKQFKSINTYDYIITLIERKKKPLLTL